MALRVLLFNGDSITTNAIPLALPSPMYRVYVTSHISEALKALQRTKKRVVVIIDYPVTNWQKSAHFMEKVAHNEQIVRQHAFILMLSTDETIPLHVSEALSLLSPMLIAKTSLKEDFVASVLMASKNLMHT